MKYLGSKRRIASYILPIMLREAARRHITKWVEPFVGGGNMIDKVPHNFERVGLDINPHVIQSLIAIRDLAADLPGSLSEYEYKNLKGADPDPIKSWLRFVASFGGKFDGGYAREKDSSERTFIDRGKQSAIKQSPGLRGVKLITSSYENCIFENCLIYCDPPYSETTQYKTGTFDHVNFWDWCRNMSIKNAVFISEYKAPDDFTCVWEGCVKTNFASKRVRSTHSASEKLFRYYLG